MVKKISKMNNNTFEFIKENLYSGVLSDILDDYEYRYEKVIGENKVHKAILDGMG